MVTLLGLAVYMETSKSRALERARKEALEVEVEQLAKEVGALKEIINGLRITPINS